MTLPVFLADDVCPALAELTVGDVCTLAGDEGVHAATVRRIGVGRELDLVDGRGLRATCVVEASAKKSLDVRVLSLVQEEELVTRLILVQALATGGRDEQAIESATEIGVDEVIPWQAMHADVQWKGERALKGQRKWENVVRAATKQSRRSRLPEVAPCMNSRALAEWIRERSADGTMVLVCHESAAEPLSALLRQLRAARETSLGESFSGSLDASPTAGAQRMPAALAVVVGPEGGIDEAEAELFRQAGARTVLLGKTILRASTAGPATLALLSDAVGRW